METIGDFFWLATAAIDVGVVWLWFLTFPAAAGLVVAGTLAIADPAPMRGKWRWIVVQPLFPVAILAYGAVFRFSGGVGGGPQWAETPIYFALIAQVVLNLVLAICVRKNALVPLGFGFFIIVMSLSAGVMSAMSVKNTWP